MWAHSCFFAESEETQTVQQGPLVGCRATAGRLVHVWNCVGKFDFKNTEKKLPFFLHSHWIKVRLYKAPALQVVDIGYALLIWFEVGVSNMRHRGQNYYQNVQYHPMVW